ncbi:MAG: hypothetical protein EOO26_06985 [Comamonadaceae bacterium]|nr:MAG: hypothetical protein EOO26_06985 [Comamonadaceae bacterium]
MRDTLHTPLAARPLFTFGAIALALLLTGCGAFRSTERAEAYSGNEWLQSSANRVANLALRDNLQSIRRVQLTLYRRNPREWRKWAPSADEAIKRTWDAVSVGTPLPELRGATGIDAIRMAFDTGPQAFQGDRVAALVYGWASMLKEANGGTWEQKMLDGTDAENAYRAARNLEISLWLLGSKTGADGQPLLLATEISERGRNLVADRELSKVTARLDLMAAQADEKYRRAALEFSQNWILGSLGPLLSMVKQ